MPERSNPAGSALDEWIAEVGEEAVAAVIAEIRQQIADGRIPSFTDKEQFLAHIQRGHQRRSA
jgi:hypothetical protein